MSLINDTAAAFSMPGLVIIAAYILDIMLGDPLWLPHPVRWIGRYISLTENKIRLFTRTQAAEKIGGILLFIIVVVTVYAFIWLLLDFTNRQLPIAHSLLSVFIAYATLSIKSLNQEASSVLNALKGLTLEDARKRLSMIVGRDTQNLSEQEIQRAVIETVAENTSDGVIAPLFYLAIGGPALAMAYKAVNTLDSMVGYKNARYKNFGWFSARMDDAANYIPARFTAILMIIASFILRFGWKESIKIIRRDSRNHPSPNSGYPEAAAAGALGLQLGGVNYYFGEPHSRPLIGDKTNEFTIEAVKNMIKLLHVTAALGVIFFASVWFIVRSL